MIANTTTVTVRTRHGRRVPAQPDADRVRRLGPGQDLRRPLPGLGLASQVRGNIEGRYSTRWTEPVARLRDYIAALTPIFQSFQDGAPLEYIGRTTPSLLLLTVLQSRPRWPARSGRAG